MLNWTRKVQTKIGGGETVYLIFGICAVIFGILVDIFLIRIICLALVAGSSLMVFSSMRSKGFSFYSKEDAEVTHFHSQMESETMKKLIFDDLQSNSRGGFKVEEVRVEESEYGKEQFPIPETQQEFKNQDVRQFNASDQRGEPAPREFQLSDFFDIDSAMYKENSEPRIEFDFLLNKILVVIKDVLFANSVVFFWANRDKNQMIMETHVTEAINFFASRRFDIGHDLVSKVAVTGKPEFISEVNTLSESELFRYYDSPASVKSFIGVPIFFSKTGDPDHLNQPVGVLAVDSKTEDEFGPETMTLLGRFTKLISALIKTYNDKYDLLLDSELLNSIRRLQERIRNHFSLPTIVQSLAEEASKLISWEFLSIVLYDEAKHAWVAKKVTNRSREGYLVTEQAIDFPESIVGETIKSNAHSFYDDLESITIPRYFSEETLEKQGSFMSVPVSSLNKCYGAINLESRDKFNFSRHDLEIVYRLAENVASALEIFYMQEIIDEYVIIDDITGMYSRKFFMQRMDEELQRADDSATDLSLLFITIDKAEEITNRFGKDGFERVIMTLAKAIRTSVRPYDIVGRYESDRFGILLVNTAANEAYLWAEKIRKTIAGLVINLDGKSFSMTISIGVSGALEKMKKEELVGNTIAVLNTASQAGGNVVRVF